MYTQYQQLLTTENVLRTFDVSASKIICSFYNFKMKRLPGPFAGMHESSSMTGTLVWVAICVHHPTSASQSAYITLLMPRDLRTSPY